jgi:hypothetical protein
MIDLYKLELISNGRVFKIYQDENIEVVFDMVTEEFDGLQDILHNALVNLIEMNFKGQELEELKENNERYIDIYTCMKDFISDEDYKGIFQEYFNNIDNLDFRLLEIEY